MADALADAIAVHAAQPVFAFPGGGSNLQEIEALAVRGVEVVVTRSEPGAAFMAATLADLTGKPGVVLVGLGPGVANAVNGVAHALLDQSALVVVSDRFSVDELATSGHQVLDHEGLLAPVTKWQQTLTADNALQAVARAFAEADAAPRGPVHLQLPRDVVGAAVDAAPEVSLAVPAAPVTDLDAAAAALSKAQRPVMLVGDEAAEARDELVALAERLGAPVLTSYKGKGVFPEAHPLWAGIVTNAAIERELLAAADLVLAMGLDPVELLPRPWELPAPVVAFRAHREAAPGYRAQWTACGDIPELVRSFAGEVGETASQWAEGDAGRWRDRMLAKLRFSAGESLTAAEIVETALAVMPPETTVSVDAGAHMLAATWFWRASLPRHFLISNGLATMGYAVPAAVAAALARPGEPVLAITGDGGFLLHGSELETAVRLGAKVIVLVVNDASLSLIRIKQEDAGYRRLAVDFGATRLEHVGRALGARSTRVSDAEGLHTALADALAATESTLIEVATTGSEYHALQHAIRG